MAGFDVVLLEGRFHLRPNRLEAHTASRGVVNVSHELEKLVGTRVRIAVHHLPTNPPDLRPGAGSCFRADCPLHRDRPDFLYTVSAEGVLRRESGGIDDGPAWFRSWWVEGFDGSRTPVELRYLDGHEGRVLAASIVDVEKMRDSLAGSGAEDLVQKVTDLKVALETLRGRK